MQKTIVRTRGVVATAMMPESNVLVRISVTLLHKEENKTLKTSLEEKFLVAPSHEPSDLSGHYGWSLVGLVGGLFVDTSLVLKISSDFKNSKTKMCFRTLYATLIFLPPPPPPPPLHDLVLCRFGLIHFRTPFVYLSFHLIISL